MISRMPHVNCFSDLNNPISVGTNRGRLETTSFDIIMIIIISITLR